MRKSDVTALGSALKSEQFVSSTGIAHRAVLRCRLLLLLPGEIEELQRSDVKSTLMWRDIPTQAPNWLLTSW